MRTKFDRLDHQEATLSEQRERKHISRPEAIRRALDAMLAEDQTASRSAVCGAWASRGDNFVVLLRDEWSR